MGSKNISSFLPLPKKPSTCTVVGCSTVHGMCFVNSPPFHSILIAYLYITVACIHRLFIEKSG